LFHPIAGRWRPACLRSRDSFRRNRFAPVDESRIPLRRDAAKSPARVECSCLTLGSRRELSKRRELLLSRQRRYACGMLWIERDQLVAQARFIVGIVKAGRHRGAKQRVFAARDQA
jgi:hypothetical protein